MSKPYPWSPADRRRFAEKVATEPDERGCLRWLASTDKDGYGQFGRPATATHAKTMAKAHRTAWEMAGGEIPPGLLVCHKCDVRACVNPAHLFLGSDQVNSDDKLAKERQARGEAHGQRRLSARDVRRMRALRERDGTPYARLAAMFGVTTMTTHAACNGKTWRHV